MADLLREQSSLNIGLSNINDELSIREKASRRARIYAQIESIKKELKEDREKCMKEFREEVSALVFLLPACLTFIAWHSSGNICDFFVVETLKKKKIDCRVSSSRICALLLENIQRILNKISNSIFCTGRSSIDFRKTKTRVITTAIQSEVNHYLEPMRAQIENKLRTNGIRFYFRLSVGNCSLKSYFRLSHRQTCLFILITALQFIPLYSVLWIWCASIQTV